MADLEPIRHFLVVFGLSIVRITAACSVVPFLSTTLIQGPVRRSLMICWGIMIYPIVAPTIEIRKMMIGLCTLPRMATPSIAPVP